MKIHEQRIKENLDRKSQFIDGKDQIQVNVDGYHFLLGLSLADRRL